MYSCTLYRNSGFNKQNIPDSPALLSQCDHFDTEPLAINHDRFLDSIKVKSTWDAIKEVDFAKVGECYYAVGPIVPINDITFLLPLDMSGTLTEGGVSTLQILDGITERVHVASDLFGLADDGDPLLTPMEPLQVETHWKNPSAASATYVESTLDIQGSATNKGETYSTTLGDEEIAVVVPQPEGSAHIACEFILPGSSRRLKHGNCVTIVSKDSDSSQTVDRGTDTGMAKLRALGLDQAIVNQVKIPDSYLAEVAHGGADEYTYVSRMRGAQGTYTVPELPFILYPSAKNNLINYSGLLKYGMISCSGESCEFSPQDLHDVNDSETYPSVKYVADPHLDGKPYFRFTKVNNDSSTAGFWRNCISGMQWKQVPLSFVGASGSQLNTMKFNNSMQQANLAAKQLKAQTEVAELQAMVGSTFNGIQSGISVGGAAGLQGAAIGAGVGAAAGIVMGGLQAAGIEEEYQYKKQGNSLKTKGELMDLAINNTVVVPTVNFPYNSETVRDNFGNGVLVYRYKYSPNDAARIDKLLTMYGYKYSKPLDRSDFMNRQYFNFVSCSSVSVTGHGKTMNDMIADELKNGVRVWHVLPNPSYYNNNPVVS